ncbi:MAG: hypothetical protein AB9903_32980 [Vulcanimicrobiota bacterium]
MKEARKGVVLVTILIMIVVLVMLLSIIVGDLKTGLYFAGNYNLEQKSYWAAHAGLEYVEHMIQLNCNWKGNSTAIPLNAGGIIVEENYTTCGAKQTNAAYGKINGGESEFYIAFANLDKSKAIIPTNDKDGKPLEYYSYNLLYQEPDDDESKIKISLGGMTRSIPRNSLYVVVEGRSKGVKTSLEAIFITDYTDYMPAVTISSGDMKFNLNDPSSKLLITHAAGDNPVIRCNDAITISDTGTNKKVLDISSGKAIAKNSISINGMQVNSGNQTEFGINAEVGKDSKKDFPRVSWEQILDRYGNPDGDEGKYKASIQAGVYAYLEDKSSKGTYSLQYYQKEYDDKFSPTGPSVYFSENSSTLLSGTDIKVEGNGSNVKTGDLTVTSATSTRVKSVKEGEVEVKSLALLCYDWDSASKSYIKSNTSRPKFLLNESEDASVTTSLCSSGKVIVRGELSGSGPVIVGGDLSFEGRSELMPDSDSGLAVYSRGNIDIMPITASEICNDPSGYLRQAVSNYIRYYGDVTYSVNSAVRNLMYVQIDQGSGKMAMLKDVLLSKYSYDISQSRQIATKLMTKNTMIEQGNGLNKMYRIISPVSGQWQDITPADSKVKGVVYTWKNFSTDLSSGSLTLQGAMVAYGGNPAREDPGSSKDSGAISISNGRYVNIIYDPNYIGFLTDENSIHKVKRIYFNRIR